MWKMGEDSPNQQELRSETFTVKFKGAVQRLRLGWEATFLEVYQNLHTALLPPVSPPTNLTP